MHLPPLKGIVAFEVVARLGSINKAADELNVTASAISHQITNLEGFVGRRLFERTSRGLVLTPVGERYRIDVAGALALIASAAQNARSSEGVEVLRIHVAPSFASLWLMPRLPQFLAAHPDLRVQLSAAFSDSDFSRGEIDLDIRYGPVRGGDLRVETVFTEQILPFASPKLLDRAAIREPNDLLGQPLILSAVNVVQWPRWFAAHGVPLSPATYALTFDRTHLAIEAAVQGLGIALDSARLAETFLVRGDLVPVFADRKAIEVHAARMIGGTWKIGSQQAIPPDQAAAQVARLLARAGGVMDSVEVRRGQRRPEDGLELRGETHVAVNESADHLPRHAIRRHGWRRRAQRDYHGGVSQQRAGRFNRMKSQASGDVHFIVAVVRAMNAPQEPCAVHRTVLEILSHVHHKYREQHRQPSRQDEPVQQAQASVSGPARDRGER